MRVFLAVFIIIATSVSGASGFETVIGGPEMDRGVFVSPTKDGGYIVVGVTRSEGEGLEDIYLVRFDSTGKMIWSRTYGGAGEDMGWSVREIDAGYVVAGFTKSFGARGYDCYLLATDFDGELQWSKTYGGEADDRCWGLLPMPDGGYALVGETLNTASGAADFLLIKTDASGEEEWAQTYGGDKGDRCFSVAPADTGFLLVGQTFSEGAGDRDAYAIKTDHRGNEEWSKTFGGPASDVGHCVAGTADGNFLITGYTTSFATSYDDPYLIKIDPKGETLWTRVLPLGGIGRTITGEQSIDGGFFLVGFRHVPGEKSGAALLIRVDRDGHVEWTRDFFHTTTGQSFGYTVRATADGGCVFTGHTTEGSVGDLDLLIVKTDSRGR